MIATSADPLTESDRQITDLMETVRHYRTHPEASQAAKEQAASDLEPVYEKIAKLQDPNGFSTHLAETISQAFHRRDRGERKKPLCRCQLPTAACPAKRGEIPPKIRTRDYDYVGSSDARELARQYVESHPKDVIVREALESFRNLRSQIYQDLNAIIMDLMADVNADADQDAREDASAGADGATVEGPVLDPTEDNQDAVAPATAPDGGEAEPTVHTVTIPIYRNGLLECRSDRRERAEDALEQVREVGRGERSLDDVDKEVRKKLSEDDRRALTDPDTEVQVEFEGNDADEQTFLDDLGDGEDQDPDEILRTALAGADTEQLAADAVDGLQELTRRFTAIRDGDAEVFDIPVSVRQSLSEDELNNLTGGSRIPKPANCLNCDHPADGEFGMELLIDDPTVENQNLRGFKCGNCEKIMSGRELINQYDGEVLDGDRDD